MADGNLYKEDKFMLSMTDGKEQAFLNPEVECIDPYYTYCVNSGANSKQRSFKFYDLYTDLYKTYNWHPCMIPFSKYGVGKGIKKGIHGIYFLSYDYDTLIKHCGCNDPLTDELKEKLFPNVVIHNFGLTLDIRNLTGIKLSYFYYNNPVRSDIKHLLIEKS